MPIKLDKLLMAVLFQLGAITSEKLHNPVGGKRMSDGQGRKEGLCWELFVRKNWEILLFPSLIE